MGRSFKHLGLSMAAIAAMGVMAAPPQSAITPSDQRTQALRMIERRAKKKKRRNGVFQFFKGGKNKGGNKYSPRPTAIGNPLIAAHMNAQHNKWHAAKFNSEVA